MTVTIINYQHQFPIEGALIKKTAMRAARYLKLSLKEIIIVFAGRARMRSINRRFLKHDYVTDVITFQDGQIIICPSMAAQNAKRHIVPFKKELQLYVVHGLIHLAGVNDKTPEDIKRMRLLEEKIMRLC